MTTAMNEDSAALERRIREAFDAGGHARAATLTLEYYGPELLGFLLSQWREDTAHEIFAEFCARFWETLPSFEWRCSMRTWAYKLVRHVAARQRRRERMRGAICLRNDPSEVSVAAERMRTVTAIYQRTDVKDRFQELRATLPREEQELLVLRVDRGLSWLELAEVMRDPGEHASDADPKVEAARLRKRFQLAKQHLRRLVVEAGLLTP